MTTEDKRRSFLADPTSNLFDYFKKEFESVNVQIGDKQKGDD
ncbi:MAG: hypothetical protein AAFO15_01800 [Pseudomonadota bacterium]